MKRVNFDAKRTGLAVLTPRSDLLNYVALTPSYKALQTKTPVGRW